MALLRYLITSTRLVTNMLNTKPIIQRYQNLVLPMSTSKTQFHTTQPSRDDVVKKLGEFFDNPKNFGENEVKHGRSWTVDELRIKSNKDLHQLWYVLLKEKNMLLTMEHECKDKCHLFPSPERLDKVKNSMENLETVVRERNKAYHQLETGETGERPGRLVSNQLGIKYFYRSSEHVIPQYMNRKWRESHIFRYKGHAVNNFLKLYREKLYNARRKAQNRDRNEVTHILRRFPNVDRTMLANKYPHVNIDKLIKTDKIRGHHESLN